MGKLTEEVITQMEYPEIFFDKAIYQGEEVDAVSLCTFPDSDEQYCRRFQIEANLFFNLLRDWKHITEPQKIADFLENKYVWDDAWDMYLYAADEGKLIDTEIVM